MRLKLLVCITLLLFPSLAFAQGCFSYTVDLPYLEIPVAEGYSYSIPQAYAVDPHRVPMSVVVYFRGDLDTPIELRHEHFVPLQFVSRVDSFFTMSLFSPGPSSQLIRTKSLDPLPDEIESHGVPACGMDGPPCLTIPHTRRISDIPQIDTFSMGFYFEEVTPFLGSDNLTLTVQASAYAAMRANGGFHTKTYTHLRPGGRIEVLYSYYPTQQPCEPVQ